MNLLAVIFLYDLVYVSLCHKDPHFLPGRNTIVHLFEWKWNDIAKECEIFLGPIGFGGVQISPPNENQIVKFADGTRPWWERYQPVSYNLTTRSGTEEELANMIKRCNAVGVRIYPDLIMNDMAALEGTGTAGSSSYPSIKFYPSVPYSADEFHQTCVVNNYNDAYNVRNCELVGLRDLDQSKFEVRNKLKSYIDKLVNLGVAGFRVDAAKHMWPADLKFIYNSVHDLSTEHGYPENSRPYFYQEVSDLGGEAISIKEYLDYADVLEFKYGVDLGKTFQGITTLNHLKNFGPAWGFVEDKDGVVFVDNHDNQRLSDKSIITFKNPKYYKAAIAFMLAHPLYITKLMSSFKFDYYDQGPPTDDYERIISPEFDTNGLCTNGWICEHRWHQIKNMVKFRNICLGTDLNKWWDNNDNQIAFSRGNKGFIAFCTSGAITELISTSLPPGIYCDVISGDLVDGTCTGKSVIIDEDGYAGVWLSDNDEDFMVAIHTGGMEIRSNT